MTHASDDIRMELESALEYAMDPFWEDRRNAAIPFSDPHTQQEYLREAESDVKKLRDAYGFTSEALDTFRQELVRGELLLEVLRSYPGGEEAAAEAEAVGR